MGAPDFWPLVAGLIAADAILLMIRWQAAL